MDNGQFHYQWSVTNVTPTIGYCYVTSFITYFNVQCTISL